MSVAMLQLIMSPSKISHDPYKFGVQVILARKFDKYWQNWLWIACQRIYKS